jgi:UDP-3-O-[3-hydroxymyristoyl] glucosamine N-acyltransferase
MGRIDHVRQASELGLMMQKITQVCRSVTFEAPVKINDTGCLGEEKVGMLTYIGSGSEIKNCNIGRFCSIARDVTIGPPEHPLDWVSSHPFQYDGLR